MDGCVRAGLYTVRVKKYKSKRYGKNEKKGRHQKGNKLRNKVSSGPEGDYKRGEVASGVNSNEGAMADTGEPFVAWVSWFRMMTSCSAGGVGGGLD